MNYVLGVVTDFLKDVHDKVSNIAIDGVNGGTYTLASVLTFMGADVRIGADLEVLSTGRINVNAGGSVNVDSGALINVDGNIVCNAGATAKVDDVDDLIVDAAVGAFRLTLTPQSVQADAGGTDPAWRPILSGTAFAGTVCGWYQHDTSFQSVIAFPISLPYGDTISTVQVSVNGSANSVGHAAKPTGGDLPTVALVRVDTAGVATVLARRADQSANVTVYNSNHTITLATGALDAGSMPQLLDENYMYYVVVTGETGANAENDKFGVTGISGATIARSFRSFVTIA